VDESFHDPLDRVCLAVGDGSADVGADRGELSVAGCAGRSVGEVGEFVAVLVKLLALSSECKKAAGAVFAR
jgi:hypothetical protein